ncbi:hypothetical protein CDD82_6150 [Ophiocordyceps australis]|uniref:Uncharacterized protein n=1 Tax=Ophiocordyceps australis TaxID=1399860 RepID=A0A2C5ZK65_9HYPO|nr:hypothetical protein CDD82_6150 [Ophiocordyceps australis]
MSDHKSASAGAMPSNLSSTKVEMPCQDTFDSQRATAQDLFGPDLPSSEDDSYVPSEQSDCSEESELATEVVQQEDSVSVAGSNEADSTPQQPTEQLSKQLESLSTTTHELSGAQFINDTNKERDEYGCLNLSCSRDVPHDDSYDEFAEKWVKSIWSRARGPADYKNAFTSAQNKVWFHPNWKLHDADCTVLKTLNYFQNALARKQVPYELWPSRVVLEMSGDFQEVERWAVRRNPTWLLLVEAILTVLYQHNELRLPSITFVKLHPKTNEVPINFLQRVRDGFYDLSHDDANSVFIREVICDHIRQHVRGVWIHIQPNERRVMTAANLIARAITLAQEEIPAPIVAKNLTTELVIDNPAKVAASR